MTPAPSGAGAGQLPIAGPGQEVVQKGRYAANVVVPFPASLIVSAPLLKSKLEEKGFTDVRVSQSRPGSWPLTGNADYYVEVGWNSAPQVFDVPSAVTAHRKVA